MKRVADVRVNGTCLMRLIPGLVALGLFSCTAPAGAEPALPEVQEEVLSHQMIHRRLVELRQASSAPWVWIESMHIPEEEAGFQYRWPASTTDVAQIVAELEMQAETAMSREMALILGYGQGGKYYFDPGSVLARGPGGTRAPNLEPGDESSPAPLRRTLSSVPTKTELVEAILHRILYGDPDSRWGARWTYEPDFRVMSIMPRFSSVTAQPLARDVDVSGTLCEAINAVVAATSTAALEWVPICFLRPSRNPPIVSVTARAGEPLLKVLGRLFERAGVVTSAFVHDRRITESAGVPKRKTVWEININRDRRFHP